MHDLNTIYPRHTDCRGIKKKKKKEKEGEDGGRAAEVSDFFIKNPNLKKQKFFWVAGEGGRCH